MPARTRNRRDASPPLPVSTAAPGGESAETSNISALAQATQANSEDRSAAAKLVALTENYDLFHNDHVAFACTNVDGKRETYRVGAQTIKNVLSHSYHRKYGTVPGEQALTSALRVLEGKALFDGPEHKVHVRIARMGDLIYLDLADAARRVIQIDATGWREVSNPPVRFVRPRGLMPLPMPVRGGSLDELRPFVNVPHLPTWRLVNAWLVAVFFEGPYCYLVLLGRQGSAKTSTSRNLRLVVDPNKSNVRAQPRNVQDLVIGAANSTFVVLDNISYIDDWLSDALARMSTGGGFATRELFTNEDEIIIDVQRPGILNGITDIVSRGDLLDRSILVELPPIPPGERRTDAEMTAGFHAAWPRILGALLDAVSGVIRHSGDVHLDELPRMADFAIRGTALERALGWPEGSFMDAYRDAIHSAQEVALDFSMIVPHVRRLAVRGWEGTASELLGELNDLFDGVWPRSPFSSSYLRSKPRPKGWPGSAVVLSGQLRRLEPNLVADGISVSFGQTQGSGSRKVISIRRLTPEVLQPPDTSPTASPASPASPEDGGRPDSTPPQAHRYDPSAFTPDGRLLDGSPPTWRPLSSQRPVGDAAQPGPPENDREAH